MKRATWAAAAALILTAPVASGQQQRGQPPSAGPPPSMTQSQTQQMHMQRQQEAMQRMNDMSTRARELNQWMTQNQAREEFKGLGGGTAAVCDRLQTMTKTMDRLRQDKQIQSDPVRRRDMDRIQDRLAVMARETDEFQTGLERVSRGTPAPGDPPASSEIQRMEQRRRELNTRIEDATRRSTELAARLKETKARQDYQDLCREIGGALDQLRLMERDMDRLESDGDLLRDRTRLREVDRMHDRLKAMVREMDEAHTTLEATVGG